MGIDDGSAYRKPNSHAACLGGVKGVEYPFAIFRGDTRSRVGHGDEKAFSRARFRADQQFTSFVIDASDGLDCVEDQIQHHLL
jgi:hypothetical protein